MNTLKRIKVEKFKNTTTIYASFETLSHIRFDTTKYRKESKSHRAKTRTVFGKEN